MKVEGRKVIAREYSEGETIMQLRRKYGISQKTVYKALVENGIETRGRPETKHNCYQALIEIKDRYLSGESTNHISKSFGVTPGTICNLLEKIGVSRIKNRSKYTDPARHQIYDNYRHTSSKRDREFHLSEEDFGILISSSCHYCGSLPKQIHKAGTRFERYYNGIDRVDNSIGYILSNVVTCCFMCNHAKSIYTQEEFLAWLDRAYNHSINSKYQG